MFDAVYESLIDTPQQSLLHVTAGATAADSVAEILRQLVGWFTTHPELATTQFELFFWNLRNNPAMASKIYTDSIEATKQAIEQVAGSVLDQKRWPLSVACSSTCSMACFWPGPPMVTRSG